MASTSRLTATENRPTVTRLRRAFAKPLPSTSLNSLSLERLCSGGELPPPPPPPPPPAEPPPPSLSPPVRSGGAETACSINPAPHFKTSPATAINKTTGLLVQHARHRVCLHRIGNRRRRRARRVVRVVIDESNEFGYQRVGIGVDGMILCRHQIGLHQN